MKRRVWVIFNESWERAMLVNNTPAEATEEEVKRMCESAGERTIKMIKETDPSEKTWIFTNTRVWEWDWLVEIKG